MLRGANVEQCPVCKSPIPNPRHSYCGECFVPVRHMRERPRLIRVVNLLAERGEQGAMIEDNEWYRELKRWQWIQDDNDGYSMITEHGKQAAQRFLGINRRAAPFK